eukprot:scaffold15668_cov109-Isochrysis_galbana.AAC.2
MCASRLRTRARRLAACLASSRAAHVWSSLQLARRSSRAPEGDAGRAASHRRSPRSHHTAGTERHRVR